MTASGGKRDDELPATPPKSDPAPIAIPLPPPETPATRAIALEGEILDELKRMNRLLYSITYGPRRYTLAFLSGITRGLGAALGATVIFALLLATLSRLDTTPLIGNYIRRVHEFIEHKGSAASHSPGFPETSVAPSATPTP